MASTVQSAADAAAGNRSGAGAKPFLNVAARLSFAALLISLCAGLAAGLGTRFHLWDYDVGLLTIFPYCLYAGIAAFALASTWMATAFFANAGAGALYAVIGFVGSIAVLWTPLDDLYLARIEHSLPPIHDISTDTEHAPAFIVPERPGATTPASYDGPLFVKLAGKIYSTEQLQKLDYSEIKPYPQLGTTPEKLFRRALKAARNMGWTIVAVEPDAEGGRIQATDTTLLFGLTDDVVIRVKPAGIGARVDVRSKSRVGHSDFGRNAARIRTYLKRLAAS